MKLSTRQGLRAGILFGIFFGLTQGIVHGAIEGAAAGLASGAMFGGAIALVLRRKERIWAALREPYEAEGLAHHGPANCAIGPGYLMLTERRLVWMPTKEADRAKQIIIAREAIAKVEQGSFGPQLRITVKTGESVQFTCGDRKVWLDRMRNVAVPLPQARVL